MVGKSEVQKLIDEYRENMQVIIGKKDEIAENTRILETPRTVNPLRAVKDMIARRRAKELEPELNEELERLEGNRNRDGLDLLYGVSVIGSSSPMRHDEGQVPNDCDTLIDLVRQSLQTDPDFRESIRNYLGYPLAYWDLVHRLAEEGNLPEHVFPPTGWGYRKAMESYSREQVQGIGEAVTLLRTLDNAKDVSGRMEFDKGDIITMGPGLSTTATSPHWLGRGGVLLIIEGAPRGVAMVGKWDDIDINENEVFIPDRIRCKVTETKHDKTVKYAGRKMFFQRIYSMRVIEASKPSSDMIGATK